MAICTVWSALRLHRGIGVHGILISNSVSVLAPKVRADNLRYKPQDHSKILAVTPSQYSQNSCVYSTGYKLTQSGSELSAVKSSHDPVESLGEINNTASESADPKLHHRSLPQRRQTPSEITSSARHHQQTIRPNQCLCTHAQFYFKQSKTSL